jgi:cytochrome c-type biogenesis protein CcmF
VLVLGVGPLTRWKRDEAGPLLRRLVLPLGLTLAAALATGWAAGRIAPATTGGLAMAYWILFSTLVDLRQRLWPAGGRAGQLLHRARLIPRAVAGMMLAHLGVGVFAFGVSMVNTYETERDVKMSPGDTTTIGSYTFTMKDVREVQGPNFVAAEGVIDITRDGQPVGTLSPQKRIYRVQQMPMTEAAVDGNLWRDLYVSMGEQLEGGAWVVRVHYKPFVSWIWGGCLLMMAGGLLAAADRRYRVRQAAPAGAARSASAESLA